MARILLERRDLPDDIRRLFDATDDGRAAAVHGTVEWTPPVDILETETAIEILVDLPGVPEDAVEVVFARDTLLVAGQKDSPPCHQLHAAFHLAERSFGRFARVVRLTGAYDAGCAQASLSAGELRIVLPRIEERRGRPIRIPVRG